MKLAHIADRVATRIFTSSLIGRSGLEAVIRDQCDMASGGDLSTRMLDRLCGMVSARLHNPDRYGIEGKCSYMALRRMMDAPY